ncbi:MAG: hypothetical protein ACRDTQ_15745, partial [Micromonosporaceae bacterium]
MARNQPERPWQTDVTALVQAVQFDPQPIDGLDRLMELIIATDAFPGSPEQNLASIGTALASAERLADLVPQQPHTEGAVRKLLGALSVRLEQWLAHPPSVTKLPVAEWNPGPSADVVAHLEREPDFFERWLLLSFDEVADAAGDLKLAVLRLSSGSTIALVQVVGNPEPGTSLLQPGD